MRIAGVLVVLAMLAAPGAAQPADDHRAPILVPPRRSPGKAMILAGVVPALVVTAGATMMAEGGDLYPLGAFTAFAGGIVGPSAGVWYAGHSGGMGILARMGAAGVVAYGARVAYAEHECLGCDSIEADHRRRTGQRLMYAGAALWLLSTLHDVRAAERVTRTRNADRELLASGLEPPMLRGKRGRNPDAALALSLLVPAGAIAWGKVLHTDDDLDTAGWMLIGTGMVLGPATGLWYGGHPGGKGITLRTILGFLMIVGANQIEDAENCVFDCGEHDGDLTQGRLLLGGSAVLWLLSTVYDARAAARATGRWNARRGIFLAPTVFPTPTGRAPGLTLSTTF